MFLSRFYRLGAHTIKSLVKAPTLTPRTSYLPVVHNQYLRVLRHEVFSSTAAKLDSEDGNEEKEKINVTFVDKDGEDIHIKVPLGMSMLEAAHENDIDLEGACEGSLACSTCHVIVMDVDHYKTNYQIQQMRKTIFLCVHYVKIFCRSRLGCQIIAKPELEGLRLAIPAATRNFAVDGFKPKPH
ncbi:Adrenodoxin-like protein 2, mitochondrial [Sesamum alatum]|uniref:Adrenodoxin-like protein 2, mitochondrial n=1 Tax=Sesamum alatum TaxID=300844 RepID=A0AAE1XV45_9LAMI|nr:Adrenodoxin-like protein 2, mitochondrial [Sesamum alatum]